MLEADSPRHNVRYKGCLRHKQPDQVVSQQVNPDFLKDHIRCLAAEDIHSHRLLDVTDIQLYSPALLVERLQLSFAGRFGTEHRSHHDLAAGLELPHRDAFRRGLVCRFTHPVGLPLWLADGDQVVTLPKPLAATKVGYAFPGTHLLHEDVDALRLHGGNEKERRKESIADENVAGFKGFLNGA